MKNSFSVGSRTISGFLLLDWTSANAKKNEGSSAVVSIVNSSLFDLLSNKLTKFFIRTVYCSISRNESYKFNNIDLNVVSLLGKYRNYLVFHILSSKRENPLLVHIFSAAKPSRACREDTLVDTGYAILQICRNRLRGQVDPSSIAEGQKPSLIYSIYKLTAIR